MRSEGTSIAASADEAIRGVLICIAVFAVSRLILTSVGTLAQLLIEPNLVPGYYAWHEGVPKWLDIWGSFDTGWFLSIVNHGYSVAPSLEPETLGQANWAFFPLYPYLAKVLTFTGLDSYLSLLVVANACFLLALCVAWFEARDLFGARVATLTVTLLTTWPGTYIFSSGYSESTFLLMAFMCLRFGRQRRWWLAGLSAAGAVLTRNIGVFLPVAALIYFLGPVWNDRKNFQALVCSREGLVFVLAMLLPVLALGGFMGLLWERTGDPLAFFHVQAAWQRQFSWPWQTLVLPFTEGIPHERSPDMLAVWICAAGALALVWRRQWPYAVFVSCSLLVFLAAGSLSLHRLVLVLAPLYFLGAWELSRRDALAPIVIGMIATVNGAMMVGWSIGVRIF